MSLALRKWFINVPKGCQNCSYKCTRICKGLLTLHEAFLATFNIVTNIYMLFSNKSTNQMQQLLKFIT